MPNIGDDVRNNPHTKKKVRPRKDTDTEKNMSKKRPCYRKKDTQEITLIQKQRSPSNGTALVQ